MSAWRTAPASTADSNHPHTAADGQALQGGVYSREHEHGFLRRAEVRDVLAWLRLLVDPHDAAAVVRALARPPIELRQVDLARVIQLARRRKVHLVLGLAAATESPHVPPDARERIHRFVDLHRNAVADLEALAPDAFVERLIERLGMPARTLLAPDDAARQRASFERLCALTADLLARSPHAGLNDVARELDRDAREAPDPGPSSEGLPGDGLEETLKRLREEVLASVGRIGGRLGELRLDTDIDVSHGVARYLELLKVSALLQRPPGEGLAEAVADVNARLYAASTPLQREILQTSALDEALLGNSADGRIGAQALGGERAYYEPSLRPFLPQRGVGLALSASDIQTYRSCPLRYKFARVLRIPTEQTENQRFGIVVHQVLERYHSDGGSTLAQLLGLLDASWRRAGFGEGERHAELRELAHEALVRYHARLAEGGAEPVWFERQFDFRIGPHHLRGRVDRVDRLAATNGSEGVERYELIDYKTSRAKTAEQLREDVQLSLYALAAREAWQLESASQSYYYVLDDVKVQVPAGARGGESVEDMVMSVGDGILAQDFEPTPSHAACSLCDYRIVCPAAER